LKLRRLGWAGLARLGWLALALALAQAP